MSSTMLLNVLPILTTKSQREEILSNGSVSRDYRMIFGRYKRRKARLGARNIEAARLKRLPPTKDHQIPDGPLMVKVEIRCSPATQRIGPKKLERGKMVHLQKTSALGPEGIEIGPPALLVSVHTGTALEPGPVQRVSDGCSVLAL